MTADEFDSDFWERRWTQAVNEHPEAIADRPPNAHVVADLTALSPGRALDAGCGHGSEAMWLATRGWNVTGVDFSATALEQARLRAQTIGDEVAQRIEWVEGDLTDWTPPSAAFDLVVCVYVHSSGPVVEMVKRLGAGVAPGGTVFLVGHRPIDPATGASTPSAGQNQVSVETALEALDESAWSIEVAEERERGAAGSGVDAVVKAVAL